MNVIGSAASTLLSVAALVYVRSFAFRLSGSMIRKPPAKHTLQASPPATTQFMNISAYVNEIYSMNYYSEFGQVVPFHNIQHGNNIMEFASWYVSKMGFNDVDKLILVVSAISHDLMHPGTRCPKNNQEWVDKYFIQDVRKRFSVGHGLGGFASEVWVELQRGGVKKDQMLVALAHEIVPLKEGDVLVESPAVELLMVERAPQEVLHAWVTIQLLKKLNQEIDPSSTAKILINILMTSISLQFTLTYSGIRGAEAAHVEMMCRDLFFQTFQCGLLLHLLDMGWCTQGQCANDGICTKIGGVEPSLVFGPRFMAESKFYNTKTFLEFKGGEERFVGMVTHLVHHLAKSSQKWADVILEDLDLVNDISAIEESLAKVKESPVFQTQPVPGDTMSPWMYVTLIESALNHKRTIDTPEFKDALVSYVDVFRKIEQLGGVEKEELSQNWPEAWLEDWKKEKASK